MLAPSREPLLGRFIRSHADEILRLWERKVRSIERAQRMSEPQVIDHLPLVLERIARLADEFERGGQKAEPNPEAREHARQRARSGFDLPEVVSEYRLLRDCILAIWEERTDGSSRSRVSTRPVNSAIDHAVAESVEQYVAIRNRALRAVDDVSTVAFASRTLDEMLSRLLRVFLDSLPTVQTCVILLREGDRLHTCASVGLEESSGSQGDADVSLCVGDGFVATIAETQRPLLINDAANDPRVTTPGIRAKGVKVIYGVPLLYRDKGVIGVAHVGSVTADDFSDDDKDLFRSMLDRAALAIEYHLAKAAADEAVKTRDEMLAIVSHDLRNPLANVIAATELLRRVTLQEPRNDRQQRTIDAIQRSAGRMMRLVDDLLDFGSIEGRQLRVSLEPVPAKELIEEAVEAHTAMVEEHGIHLASSVEPNLPRVACDRDRVFQVLANLIGNAVKFSPAGATITVSAKRDENTVLFSVADEGVGIDEAELPHVFDLYWRGRDSTAKGRGLGLSIVKGIVEAHGGSVGLRSIKGRGSTFFFRLPVAAGPTDSRRPT